MPASPVRARTFRHARFTVLAGMALAACAHAKSNVAAPASAVVNESLQSVPPGPPIVPGAGDTFVSRLPSQLNEPKYPDAARAAKVSAVIAAQYVVNADGRVEVSTLKVLSVTSTPSSPALHDAFVQSLRDALPTFRYQPAVVKGQNVKQLVRTGFTYTFR